jgi:hypothetical protein
VHESNSRPLAAARYGLRRVTTRGARTMPTLSRADFGSIFDADNHYWEASDALYPLHGAV